jgi:hypothetical protein
MSHALPYLAGFLVALLVAFYIYSAAVATWHVRNSAYLSRSQKLAQLAIIWLLPIVGVAFVLHMLGPEERMRRPGWVPLLEPLVLAAFIHSSSGTTEDSSYGCASADSTASHDGGCDCGGGDGGGGD